MLDCLVYLLICLNYFLLGVHGIVNCAWESSSIFFLYADRVVILYTASNMNLNGTYFLIL